MNCTKQVLLFLLFSFFIFTNCTNEDDPITNPNNEKSAIIPLDSEEGLYIEELDITLVIFENKLIVSESPRRGVDILDLGNITSLKQITEIPSLDIWNDLIYKDDIQIQNGYLIVEYSKEEVVYIKLLIESYTDSQEAVKIKYETYFNGTAKKIELLWNPEEAIKISAPYDYAIARIELGNLINYTVTSDIEGVSFDCYPEMFWIYFISDKGIQPGTITISSEKLESIELKVEREEDARTIYAYRPKNMYNTDYYPAHYRRNFKYNFCEYSIHSNGDWKVESNAEWCKVSKGIEQGIIGIKEIIRVEFLENKTNKKREATVKISPVITGSQIQGEGETFTFTQGYKHTGEGTERSPYLIRTAEELDDIRFYRDEGDMQNPIVFELKNDIDLTEYLSKNKTGWEPIGNLHTEIIDYTVDYENFYIKLNGKGHIINGLWTYNSSTEENKGGLFGLLQYGDISELGVIMNEKGITGKYQYAGILCGELMNGKISSCYTDGKISSILNDNEIYLGGIIGKSHMKTDILNCYSTAHLMAPGDYYNHYLSGITTDANKIENCYFPGLFSLLRGTEIISGIGIANNIISSYYNSDTTDCSEGNTTEEMRQKNTYKNWDFTNIWEIQEGISYPILRCFNK